MTGTSRQTNANIALLNVYDKSSRDFRMAWTEYVFKALARAFKAVPKEWDRVRQSLEVSHCERSCPLAAIKYPFPEWHSR